MTRISLLSILFLTSNSFFFLVSTCSRVLVVSVSKCPHAPEFLSYSVYVFISFKEYGIWNFNCKYEKKQKKRLYGINGIKYHWFQWYTDTHTVCVPTVFHKFTGSFSGTSLVLPSNHPSVSRLCHLRSSRFAFGRPRPKSLHLPVEGEEEKGSVEI
jgi:hypothetical protein